MSSDNLAYQENGDSSPQTYQEYCLVCGTQNEYDSGHLAQKCPNCSFYYMKHEDLTSKIKSDDEVSMQNFRNAIHGIRERNFRLIISEIEKIRPFSSMNCLDIGCAYGHFLSIVKKIAKSAIGIEPNDQMKREAESNGVEVISGFFPDDLPKDAKYDLISFNDVLEHLPDPKAALRAVHDSLSKDGLLLISIPSSDGIVFKISSLFQRLGSKALSDRIWQKQFYTPHISYFNRKNLTQLAGIVGFEPLKSDALPVVEGKSIYHRISVDNTIPFYKKVILTVAGFTYAVISSFMPEEYFFTVFRKIEND